MNSDALPRPSLAGTIGCPAQKTQRDPRQQTYEPLQQVVSEMIASQTIPRVWLVRLLADS